MFKTLDDFTRYLSELREASGHLDRIEQVDMQAYTNQLTEFNRQMEIAMAKVDEFRSKLKELATGIGDLVAKLKDGNLDETQEAEVLDGLTAGVDAIHAALAPTA